MQHIEYWIRLSVLFIVNLVVWCALGGIMFLLIGHPTFGIMLGFVGGIVYWMIASFVSDKFALEHYGAVMLDQRSAPRIYELVEDICRTTGVHLPRLYFVPLKTPNAFAVGHGVDSATIVVTNGLVTDLSYGEARAILSLMISRIKNADAGVYGIASALAGIPLGGLPIMGSDEVMVGSSDPGRAILSMLTRLRIACVLPYCALMLKLACNPYTISRTDTDAIKLGGDASDFALAIGKIADGLPKNWWEAAVYHPATALLFAVPPLPPLDPSNQPTPRWLSLIHQFPYRAPAPEERFRAATRAAIG